MLHRNHAPNVNGILITSRPDYYDRVFGDLGQGEFLEWYNVDLQVGPRCVTMKGGCPSSRIPARISSRFWERTELDVSLIWDVVAGTDFCGDRKASPCASEALLVFPCSWPMLDPLHAWLWDVMPLWQPLPDSGCWSQLLHAMQPRMVHLSSCLRAW